MNNNIRLFQLMVYLITIVAIVGVGYGTYLNYIRHYSDMVVVGLIALIPSIIVFVIEIIVFEGGRKQGGIKNE